MNLKDFLCLKGRGSAISLANQIGVSAFDVCMWRNGKRPVPIKYCIAIENATKGAVTRKDLRPNDYWEIWQDLPKDN